MKNDIDQKAADIKKAVSGIADDAKRNIAYAEQKVSAMAKEAGKNADKAGNEMKAGLQQLKNDVKQFPKKADKKSRK